MYDRMHELTFCDILSYRSINIFSKFKVCEMLAMHVLISILTSMINIRSKFQISSRKNGMMKIIKREKIYIRITCRNILFISSFCYSNSL